VGENTGNNGVFEPEMHGNGGGLPTVEDSVEEEPSEIQGVSRMIELLYYAPIQDLQEVESTGEYLVHLSRADEPGVETSSRPPYQLAPGQVWMIADHDQLNAMMARLGISQSDLGLYLWNE